MELAKIKPDGIIAAALKSKPMAELQPVEAKRHLCDVISLTYFSAGQQFPGKDANEQARHLQVLAAALLEEIKTVFPTIREKEVSEAFRRGVREEYGQYFGLNIISFHKWLKGWQTDEKRVNALRQARAGEQAPLRQVMSKDEAEFEWRQIILRRFKEYKTTGVFYSEQPRFEFLEFEKRGLISLTAEAKERIRGLALAKVIESMKIERLNCSHARRQAINGFIERAQDGKLTKDDCARVKVAASKIAIQEFYNGIDSLNI